MHLFRTGRSTLLAGAAAGVAIEAFELFCTQPLLAHLTGRMPDLSAFSRAAGNLQWLLVSLALTWTLFAFGEELVFRGCLMQRIAGLLGESRQAWTAALLATSFAFGLSHFQQGITGVSENFVDGVILGALCWRLGRSLAVPIVAQGLPTRSTLCFCFCTGIPGSPEGSTALREQIAVEAPDGIPSPRGTLTAPVASTILD